MDFCVEHLGLPSNDPIALQDWYVKTFDGQMIYTDGATPPAFFVKLPGGIILEIYQSTRSLPDTADNKLAGWRHVALRVKSIEKARALLESRGVKFSAPVNTAGGGGRVQYFADPEGNLIHLVDRPADAPILVAQK